MSVEARTAITKPNSLAAGPAGLYARGGGTQRAFSQRLRPRDWREHGHDEQGEPVARRGLGGQALVLLGGEGRCGRRRTLPGVPHEPSGSSASRGSHTVTGVCRHNHSSRAIADLEDVAVGVVVDVEHAPLPRIEIGLSQAEAGGGLRDPRRHR
jgi:hypothetical protein